MSDHDRALLDLEGRWWRTPGAKEQAVRDQLGLTPTRYYQQLRQLLDRPETLEHNPVLVNRLRARLSRKALRRRAASHG